MHNTYIGGEKKIYRRKKKSRGTGEIEWVAPYKQSTLYTYKKKERNDNAKRKKKKQQITADTISSSQQITAWQILSSITQGLSVHSVEHIPSPINVCYLFAVKLSKQVSSDSGSQMG